MLVLGLLLAGAAVAFTVGIVLDSTISSPPVHLYGMHFSGLTLGGTFVVGCICGLVFAIGIMLMAASLARWRTARTERRAVVSREAYPAEPAPVRTRASEPVTTVTAPTDTGRHRAEP